MRLIKVLMLLPFLTLCHHPVHAETLSLIHGAWSSHLSSDGYKEKGEVKEYNEEHEAYGLRYGSHSLFTFINSYRARGYAYQHTWDTCSRHDYIKLCALVNAGITTGYARHLDKPLLPTAGLGGTVGVSGLNLNIQYVPFADVLIFQLETELM